MQAAIRDEVLRASETASTEHLARIADDGEGDTIFAIDRIGEPLLCELVERELAADAPVVLVGEGLPDGRLTLPAGAAEEDAPWIVIVDPIDGTRGLMYQKRSAWILTGVARNRGRETNLSDIELAVQTEIPLRKQHLSDVLWAVRRQGAHGERYDRLTGASWPLPLSPSTSSTIEHGYAMISRFFPGARDELAAIDEEIVRGVLGPARAGKAHCFEDQYAATGGQLYELAIGHDRFVADLRPLLGDELARRGLPLGICCHPYDLCTALIAEEAGVLVGDPNGDALTAPLDVEADVAWVGYANKAIRAQVEPLLREALERRSLLHA
jgi:fructose-1,6-bisphosphatase/inositol monophosphatase family enzyme